MTERGTERSSQRRDARRVSVGEAAALLGVSKDAVRMRIRRGTLRAEKAEGRVYVWLAEDLNEQVHHFRQILAEERDARRRADTIIAQLTQANAALAARVPELEAPSTAEPPSDAREDTVTATPQPGRAEFAV